MGTEAPAAHDGAAAPALLSPRAPVPPSSATECTAPGYAAKLFWGMRIAQLYSRNFAQLCATRYIEIRVETVCLIIRFLLTTCYMSTHCQRPIQASDHMGENCCCRPSLAGSKRSITVVALHWSPLAAAVASPCCCEVGSDRVWLPTALAAGPLRRLVYNLNMLIFAALLLLPLWWHALGTWITV
mgnify:CR=1 FL=1